MVDLKNDGVNVERGIAFGKAIGYEVDEANVEYVSELTTLEEEENEEDEGRISSHPSTKIANRSDVSVYEYRY
jgi:hypothetical protein